MEVDDVIEDTGTEEAFDPHADILPDSILDKHLNPEPAADDDESDDDSDDTLDDEDLEEEEDDDESEDGDELEDDLDDLDEDEEDEDLEDDDLDDDSDEDEESDEADDEEEVLENVSAEDRKAIEKDPRLRKIHKLMQRDYTKKTTEVAELERTLTQRSERLENVEKALQTPQGMVSFLTRNLREHPEIIGAAFEASALADKGSTKGYDFLVEVGLHSPDVLLKAAERVQELQDDETEMSRHVRDRDSKSESNRVRRERQKLAQDRYDRQSGELMNEAVRYAKRLNIHPDDLSDVRDTVIAMMDKATQNDGNIDLSRVAVRKAIKAEKAKIDSKLERVKARTKSKSASEKREAVKKKAARAKKKTPRPSRGGPGSLSIKGSKRKAARAVRGKIPEGVDPLDHYLDNRIGR